KPMAVTLPCVLLLLDFWPLRRFELSTLPRLLLGKIPFFILSAGVCWLTMAAQKTAIVSTAGLPLPQRIAHVLLAYVHYVVAMFFPINLSAYYPYETSIPSAHATFAFILLAVVSGLVFAFRRSRPYLAFGWLWFLGTLVPVVGLVQVGEQAWADRYTYLPLIGLFIAVVWGAAELVKNKFILRVVATAALVILSATTCVQLKYWRNTRALFEHASQVTPNNYMAVTLLGSLLAKEGKFNEAIEYYRRALSYKPSYPEAHFFLGHALDQQGKLDEAIAEYRKSLGFKPALEQTHIFLGLALAKQKQDSEAESHYLAALKINPESAGAHNALARLLHAQGRFSDAFAHYQAALKSDPNLAPAHNNLGILLLQEGRPKEGALELREAMKLNPSNPETEYNLALALNQLAQWQEASELFSKTVGRSSTDANAHSQFAVALAHANKTREAMAQYASALLLQPDFPDALDGLAWILSTDPSPAVRNGIEAVRMAERACELTGRKDAEKLKTLAAAYAEAGRFPEAIAATQSAFDLASRTRQTALAEECEQMSSSYKLAKPWRADR
ncbi:MAG: tetratricopeptide repeat protein, partial [Verrucomicrobia bacterium]